MRSIARMKWVGLTASPRRTYASVFQNPLLPELYHQPAENWIERLSTLTDVEETVSLLQFLKESDDKRFRVFAALPAAGELFKEIRARINEDPALQTLGNAAFLFSSFAENLDQPRLLELAPLLQKLLSGNNESHAALTHTVQVLDAVGLKCAELGVTMGPQVAKRIKEFWLLYEEKMTVFQKAVVLVSLASHAEGNVSVIDTAAKKVATEFRLANSANQVAVFCELLIASKVVARANGSSVLMKQIAEVDRAFDTTPLEFGMDTQTVRRYHLAIQTEGANPPTPNFDYYLSKMVPFMIFQGDSEALAGFVRASEGRKNFFSATQLEYLLDLLSSQISVTIHPAKRRTLAEAVEGLKRRLGTTANASPTN